MDAAVETRALGKSFGAVRAVDGVSMRVEPGEIVAVLGPSGCGKTTLLRLVAGFERPDAGAVSLAGAEVASNGTFVPPDRRRVGFVFQDYALFPHMTVAGNVGFGVPDRRARRARVREVLSLVGLGAHSARYPHELSGGQQQRVALARALAPSPSLVLLDEPFASLDADLRARVRAEVRDILRGAGTAAIFVTHDQEEAFEIADRVAVMRDGAIEQVGAPEEIYHTPETRFVADFVGEADFLPASVEGNRVVTELGGFVLDAIRLEPADVTVMVRPEDIEIAAGGGAEVVARRFQGPVSLTTVRLPSGRTVASAHSSQTLFQAGDAVRVRFRPDHLVVFEGDRRVALIRARAETGTDRLGP